jgi:hypothetical protein
MGLFGVGGLLWALIPLYDKDSASAKRARNATWFGIFAVVALIVSTIWAYAEL